MAFSYQSAMSTTKVKSSSEPVEAPSAKMCGYKEDLKNLSSLGISDHRKISEVIVARKLISRAP